MFGYVRPAAQRLSDAENQRFRDAYCGLCHTLARRYGFAARFLLNFDFTFLAILLSLGMELSSRCERCVVHPCKGCGTLEPSAALDTAADHSIVLSWWQIQDHIADHGFWKGLPYRLAALIFHDIMKILKSGRGEAYSTRHSYIQDALQHISENLSEPMTVDSLADMFGVGHTKFAEDFKSVTGSTYKKYLTDLRMTRARELLTSGSSIINASLETGFSGEAQFIATYKRYFGETPGSYAKVRSKSEK